MRGNGLKSKTQTRDTHYEQFYEGGVAEWLGRCMDLKSGDPEFKSRTDH